MNRFVFSLAFALLAFTGCQSADETHSHGPDGDHTHEGGDADHTHGPGGHTHAGGAAHAFSYLGMDGAFEMDPEHRPTREDPRNPSRIRLATSDEAGSFSRMAFYAHDDPSRLVADCGYQYVGSFPDPHYFPDESKTSIWDAFERTESFEGDCDGYAAVISRSPHGEPAHLHLRYGEDVQALLTMSTVPVDSARFEPWWPLFCEPGRTTTCE